MLGELIFGHVSLHQLYVLPAGALDPLPRAFQHLRGQVNSDEASFRSDSVNEKSEIHASSAPKLDDAVSLLRAKTRHCLGPVASVTKPQEPKKLRIDVIKLRAPLVYAPNCRF